MPMPPIRASAVALVLLLVSLSPSLPLAAQEHRPHRRPGGGGRAGRADRRRAGRSRSDAPIRAVSALDGRYTLAGVPAGPVSVRVRMIGFAPKDGDGRRGAGRARRWRRTSSMAAEAVQLAEISVSAEAERGTVNRALEEQRNAANIINAVTAEQIARSPDSDAGQAVQRVSGVTVQDGKYVFVRGLGERYTTTSLDGARIPSPEPERRVVPLDLFPSSLLEGITTSKTFTPEQPGDFSGAQVNLKTREFPLGRVITLLRLGRVQRRGDRQGRGQGADGGPRVARLRRRRRGSCPAQRRCRRRPERPDAGPAERADRIVPERLERARRRTVAPTASFGVSIGGRRSGLRPADRLHRLVQLLQRAGSAAAEETKGLATLGSTPGDRRCLSTRYTGSSARKQRAVGRAAQPEHADRCRPPGSRSTTPTPAARTTRLRTSMGFNEEFSQSTFDFTRLTFIERARALEPALGRASARASGNLRRWAVTSAGVTRNEPDRSDIGYLAAPDARRGAAGAGGVVRAGAVRHPDLQRPATSTAGISAATTGCCLGSLGARRWRSRSAAAYRTVDRDADSRAYDIVNRTLDDAERPAGARGDLHAPRTSGRATSCSNANANAAGATPLPTGSPRGTSRWRCRSSSRLQVIGGARVENWRLDVDTRTVQGTIVPATPARRPTCSPRSR